jgi:16S rRNA (uracil1498-N3)-methyltransferase
LPADAAPSFLWVESLPAAGERCTLGADDSRYLARVCRARVGERVTLTDGRGGLAQGELVEVAPRARVEVTGVERQERRGRAGLLCGAPEGERADWLVEKLAELGVAWLQPIQCQRGTWERMESRKDRWQRLAVAALRQSRRRFRMEIMAAVSLGDALATLPAEGLRVLADPAGEPAASVPAASTSVVVGIVGPAEGLTEAEKSAVAGSGFRAIALSDSRLRTETAAIAWAAWWAAGSRARRRNSFEA